MLDDELLDLFTFDLGVDDLFERVALESRDELRERVASELFLVELLLSLALGREDEDPRLLSTSVRVLGPGVVVLVFDRSEPPRVLASLDPGGVAGRDLLV